MILAVFDDKLQFFAFIFAVYYEFFNNQFSLYHKEHLRSASNWAATNEIITR